MTEKMKVSKRPLKSGEVIDIHGSISLEAAKEIAKFIKKTAAKDDEIYVNLAGVSYMNSAALSVLVQLIRELSEKKITVFFINVHEKIGSLIRIAGLHNVFKILTDETEVIERLDKREKNVIV